MYLYSFSSLAWQDGVFSAPTLDPKFKSWDLIKNDEGYFLVLGEEISFPELYHNLYPNTQDFILVEQALTFSLDYGTFCIEWCISDFLVIRWL